MPWAGLLHRRNPVDSVFLTLLVIRRGFLLSLVPDPRRQAAGDGDAEPPPTKRPTVATRRRIRLAWPPDEPRHD